MKLFVVLSLCLYATSACADQFEFRGDFVETHMAEKGFLDTIPKSTRLNCEDSICSNEKSVRIYVFRNRDGKKSFWSTDYSDVMFDEPEKMLTCGRTRYVVRFDETGQLMYKDQVCDEEIGPRLTVTFPMITLGLKTMD